MKVITDLIASVNYHAGKKGYNTKMFRYQLFTVFKSVKATRIEIYSGGSRGGARGAVPALIFRPDWVPKAGKNFWRPPPLSKGLDDRASPYLQIWIPHWSITYLQYHVCDNRDKVFTWACKFFRSLHLTSLCSDLLQKDLYIGRWILQGLFF